MAKPNIEHTRWAVTAGGTESTEVSEPDGDLKDDGYPPSGDASIPLNTDWNWLHRKAHAWFQYLDALIDSSDAWIFPADLVVRDNVRVADPLTFTPKTFTTGGGAGYVTVTSHGLQTGDGPLLPSTTGSFPTNLSAGVPVWPIKVDNNTLALAVSHGDALAKNPVSVTGGSGTHTLTAAPRAIVGSGTHGAGPNVLASSGLGSVDRDISLVGRLAVDGTITAPDIRHSSVQSIQLHPALGQVDSAAPSATYDSANHKWIVAATGAMQYAIPCRVGDSFIRFRIYFNKASSGATTLTFALKVKSAPSTASATLYGAGVQTVLTLTNNANAPGDVSGASVALSSSPPVVLLGGSWSLEISSSSGTGGDSWATGEVDVVRIGA